MFNPKNQKKFLLDGLFTGAANLASSFFTNRTNESVSDKNINFQREVQEYNKALQERLFEREDTAYQRQVADAQAVGINPMALASTGGARAGDIVPVEPLHSDFQAQSPVFSGLGDVSPILQIADTYNNLQQGYAQRDLLQSQVDMQNLQNAITAFQNGVIKNKDGSYSFEPDNLLNLELRSLKASTERNERVNDYQNQSGLNDTTSQPSKSFIDIVEGVKNNPNSKNLRERLLTWLQDNNDKNVQHWKPSDYFDNSNSNLTTNKLKNGLSDIYDNGIHQIKDFFEFIKSKKRSKNIKDKHSNYYNDLIRNNYINAN